jgi:hypothetical protein
MKLADISFAFSQTLLLADIYAAGTDLCNLAGEEGVEPNKTTAKKRGPLLLNSLKFNSLCCNMNEKGLLLSSQLPVRLS